MVGRTAASERAISTRHRTRNFSPSLARIHMASETDISVIAELDGLYASYSLQNMHTLTTAFLRAIASYVSVASSGESYIRCRTEWC